MVVERAPAGSAIIAAVARKRAAITGVTGLVGGNLAEALLRDGHAVVAVRRGSSRVDHLAHLDLEWVQGDLADAASLERAFEGADVVFHCAAAVQISPRVTPLLHEGNVVGTRNVMDAVRRAKVARLVHCSSVTAAAVSDGSRDVTEDDAWNFPEHGLADGYATTKHQSQEEVLAAARDTGPDGIDAVVVQPTYMFGPYDVRPSSGQMVLEIARRKIPTAAPGGQNIVDVRDVARGMILAWERGRRGEKYILGGQNVTYAEMFRRIARVLDVPPPRWSAPFAVAWLVGAVAEAANALIGRDSPVSRSTVRYAYHRGYRFSIAKAQRELGYAPGDPDEGIRACVAWMREHGALRPTLAKS